MMSRIAWDPFSYQLRILQFLHQHERAFVGAGAGLGKTVTLLTHLLFLLGGGGMERRIGRALVIAPKRVALTVWAQEAEKWVHTAGLDIEVICGADWRERIRASKADVVVISYTQVASVVRGDKLFKGVVDLFGRNWPFECLILDESTKIKNPSSSVYKAVRKVKELASHIYLLSGTPAPNGLLDLWPQMATIDVGGDLLQDLGRSITTYKSKFFKPDYNGWVWTPLDWAPERIHEIVARKMISLKSEDYLDLPPYVVNPVYVQLDRTARELYDEMEKHMYLELEGAEVEAVNAATLTGKCRQLASGFIYTDTEGGYKQTHTAKVDALEDLVEESAGAPVLVVYDFQAELDALRKKFGKQLVVMADSKRPSEVIDAWNAGKIGLLAIHPKSAGHGLNLQRGGNIVAWYGNTWSSEEYDQVNARLHRTGQSRRVFVHLIIAEGTIDELVFKAVQEKRRVQDVLLEATKLRALR